MDKKKAVLGARNANVGGASGHAGKTVEETYKKLSQHEHILARPDSYVGSVQRVTQPMWVFDTTTSTSEWGASRVRRSCHSRSSFAAVAHRPTSFVPALYKLFDEILVNAADNKQRDKSMVRQQWSKGIRGCNLRGPPCPPRSEHSQGVHRSGYQHHLRVE